MNQEILTYQKHMNLKLAANELGIAWQSLYVRLKKAGVPVSGDKLRYGTDRDKLGAIGESHFKALVPFAMSRNDYEYQSKYDFDVCGFKIDVKASRPHKLNQKYESLSWAFSFKKQTLVCDFICCFCMDEEKEIECVLLIPKEFFKGLKTITVSRNGDSKWKDYSINPSELADFFSSLAESEAVQPNF